MQNTDNGTISVFAQKTVIVADKTNQNFVHIWLAFNNSYKNAL